MEKDLNQLLFESLDRDLSVAERRRLAEALLPRPDPAFARKVRERRRRKEAFSGRVVSLFPRVVAACLLLFLLSVLAAYLSSGSLDAEVILGTQDLTVEAAYALTME